MDTFVDFSVQIYRYSTYERHFSVKKYTCARAFFTFRGDFTAFSGFIGSQFYRKIVFFVSMES